MDTLYQMAHTKSPKTHQTVCGMNTEPNTITCMAGGAEMLKIGPDGFWVRGERVAQDDKEAQAVYNAFKAWMTWATLNKDYQ